ncbi:IclR family transcriptional regulator [Bradyrhizobium sp. CB82]|uniref:IclR family transcriptional regulator n=1 Tax=Bradyrhizobium sp. CB82 TaxID=3039159 RepID=UPI0024B10419|nr:IclR family transcriptional regulator [Bradyrhizobium sp. CB82]WFU44917.1 IclR family transcriptional regulator [Bradyrhizobium sp. CB82]
MADGQRSERIAGTQSIDRAIELLLLVGRASPQGSRLSDLVKRSQLPKPTVRRVLLALVRAGLLDQDESTRLYFLGPESYVIGTLATARFGIHALALDGLARLSQATSDTTFLSVRRGTFSVCLHREEGSYPIRTHVLQAGDRHPLGVGAGSLALLSALADDEIDAILRANASVLREQYPKFSSVLLRRLIEQTRKRGYALNPGLLMQGSWGIGVPIRDGDGHVVGALSIAAVEQRLDEARQRILVPSLQAEAKRLEELLSQSRGSAPRSVPTVGSPREKSRRLLQAELPTRPPPRRKT